MVKKNFLFILISLFAIALLFSGCSKQQDTTNKVADAKIKVESDVPVQTTNTVAVKTTDVVDTSFNTQTADNTSDVEIGSLI